MTIDKSTLHPVTDRLVTAYWRLRSQRACLMCAARARVHAGIRHRAWH
jgi:hypothetical protein